MIEAVKSTVANGVLLRGNVEQSSTLTSYAANPDKIQSTSQVPYTSPTVRIDVATKMAILEFREALSGEVVSQIPTEQALRTYRMSHPQEDAEEIAQKAAGTQEGSATTQTSSSAGEASGLSRYAGTSAGNSPVEGGSSAGASAVTDATDTQVSI